MTDQRETFGTRMRRYRVWRKISQAQLSEEIRVSQTSISDYENDIKIPNIYVGSRIATVLRFSVKGLVEKP